MAPTTKNSTKDKAKKKTAKKKLRVRRSTRIIRPDPSQTSPLNNATAGNRLRTPSKTRRSKVRLTDEPSVPTLETLKPKEKNFPKFDLNGDLGPSEVKVLHDKFYEMLPSSPFWTKKFLSRCPLLDKYPEICSEILLCKSNGGVAKRGLRQKLSSYDVQTDDNSIYYGPKIPGDFQGTIDKVFVPYEYLFDTLYYSATNPPDSKIHSQTQMKKSISSFYNITENLAVWYCQHICHKCSANTKDSSSSVFARSSRYPNTHISDYFKNKTAAIHFCNDESSVQGINSIPQIDPPAQMPTLPQPSLDTILPGYSNSQLSPNTLMPMLPPPMPMPKSATLPPYPNCGKYDYDSLFFLSTSICFIFTHYLCQRPQDRFSTC